MPFMDKVKAGAAQAAQKAQEAAKAGQAKIDQVQAKRELDSMYRDLGAAVYEQRTGAGSGNSDAEIERLVGAITAHQEQNPTESSSMTQTAASGDFKLDD
jgi:hypothetical protein